MLNKDATYKTTKSDLFTYGGISIYKFFYLKRRSSVQFIRSNLRYESLFTVCLNSELKFSVPTKNMKWGFTFIVPHAVSVLWSLYLQ